MTPPEESNELPRRFPGLWDESVSAAEAEESNGQRVPVNGGAQLAWCPAARLLSSMCCNFQAYEFGEVHQKSQNDVRRERPDHPCAHGPFPGVRMPILGIGDDDAKELIAYLETASARIAEGTPPDPPRAGRRDQ